MHDIDYMHTVQLNKIGCYFILTDSDFFLCSYDLFFVFLSPFSFSLILNFVFLPFKVLLLLYIDLFFVLHGANIMFKFIRLAYTPFSYCIQIAPHLIGTSLKTCDGSIISLQEIFLRPLARIESSQNKQQSFAIIESEL